MSSCPDPRARPHQVPRTGCPALAVAAAWLLVIGAGTAEAQTAYPGVGRSATPKEVGAWNIDVRPDFKGLPKGSGSVAKGQDVWEAKCASMFHAATSFGVAARPTPG